MGIYEQARYTGTPLSRFIRDHLPHAALVVDDWTQQLATVDGELPVPGWRDDLGWVLELCLDLDLAATPPRQRELSFLPADRYEALLTAAGYRHHPIGVLPAGAVTDPWLWHWKRAEHPAALDDTRRTVFATCLELASLRKVMHHRLIRRQNVEQRRSLFHRTIIDFAESDTGTPDLVAALERCWSVYLAHGRRRLQERGEKVIVAPELASGYAVADLVMGYLSV